MTLLEYKVFIEGIPVKQMTLMEFFSFEAEDLENDYNSIVAGLIDPDEGYRHYVIAYDAEGSELKDVQVEFLDKDFNTISTASLNEYIKPDFSRLTDVEHVDEVGSELMLTGYRYAMKKLNTPVENVVFYFKDDNNEYQPYSFDETLKVKNCPGYPSLYQVMLFELL